MACLFQQPFRVTGPAMASLKAGLKDSVEILLPSVWNQCRRWERFLHLASGITYSSSASSRNSFRFNSSYQITSQERTVELCLQPKCWSTTCLQGSSSDLFVLQLWCMLRVYSALLASSQNLLSTWEMWAAMGWGSGELHRETFSSMHHITVCFPLIATHGVTRYICGWSDICNLNSGYQQLEWFCPELAYTRSGKNLYVHTKLFLPSKLQFLWNIRAVGLGQTRNLFQQF